MGRREGRRGEINQVGLLLPSLCVMSLSCSYAFEGTSCLDDLGSGCARVATRTTFILVFKEEKKECLTGRLICHPRHDFSTSQFITKSGRCKYLSLISKSLFKGKLRAHLSELWKKEGPTSATYHGWSLMSNVNGERFLLHM